MNLFYSGFNNETTHIFLVSKLVLFIIKPQTGLKYIKLFAKALSNPGNRTSVYTCPILLAMVHPHFQRWSFNELRSYFAEFGKMSKTPAHAMFRYAGTKLEPGLPQP